MPPSPTVVVTDTTTPERFEAALRQVVRTVPADVAVLAVGHRSVRLPAALARRVAVRKVRFPEDLPVLTGEIAAEPGLVVVVSSGCRTEGTWWDVVTALASTAGTVVTTFGGVVPVLSLHPAGVAAEAPRVVVEDVAGVHVVTIPRRTHLAVVGEGISACLIVKDEEAVLGACLAAVSPFVDEVVVYDTGSTDATREIAAAHGAKVVEGFWNDDFGAARDRAQEHVTHDWVLNLDADEVIVGDPAEFRAFARQMPGNVATAIIISGGMGEDDGSRSSRPTLFRRSQLRWRNALHETLVARDGFDIHLDPEMVPVHFLHSGYHAATMHERGKADRNIEIAQRMAMAVRPGDTDHAPAWSAYGRSLFMADRNEEAVEALSHVLDGAPEPATLVTASRTAIHVLTGLGRLHEAERWITAVTPWEAPGAVAVARARNKIQATDLVAARVALLEVVPGPDLWGVPFDVRRATTPAIIVAIMENAFDEADALFRDQVANAPEEVDLTILVHFADLAGRQLSDYVRSSSPDLLRRSLREAVTMTPATALPWLQARYDVTPDDVEVLVAGCLVAARCGLGDMLTWSLRTRERGIADPCPLVIFSEEVANDPLERCLARGIVADAYGEPVELAAFRVLLVALDDAQQELLEPLLKGLAPGLVSAAPV